MIEFFKSHYILLSLLAGSTFISFIWLFFNRKRLNAKWWDILLAALSATIVGLLATILFGYVESGFKARDATSLFGSIFIVPLFCLVYSKIKKLPYGDVLDIFTIVLVVSAMFARVNCLIKGCCYGKPIGYTEYNYPTREIEIGFDVIFIGLAAFMILKEKFRGKIYLIYLVSYGTFGFVIEFFRYSSSNSVFHNGHVWAFLSIVIGIALLIILNYLKKTQNEQSTKRK